METWSEGGLSKDPASSSSGKPWLAGICPHCAKELTNLVGAGQNP